MNRRVAHQLATSQTLLQLRGSTSVWHSRSSTTPAPPEMMAGAQLIAEQLGAPTVIQATCGSRANPTQPVMSLHSCHRRGLTSRAPLSLVTFTARDAAAKLLAVAHAAGGTAACAYACENQHMRSHALG